MVQSAETGGQALGRRSRVLLTHADVVKTDADHTDSLIDEHAPIRALLRMLSAQEADFDVVGETGGDAAQQRRGYDRGVIPDPINQVQPLTVPEVDPEY